MVDEILPLYKVIAPTAQTHLNVYVSLKLQTDQSYFCYLICI